MADRPTIVACLGNRVGLRVARYLTEHGANVEAVVLNGGGPGAAYEPEILTVLPGVAFGSLDRTSPADLCVLAGFRHRVPASFVRCFRHGVVNLHPGYLPYNRGAYPNVWALLDGTPAGATLHYVEADDDAGVDTGPIIARRLVPTYAWDTSREVYDRCEDACVRLFETWWPLMADNVAFGGRVKSTPQEDDVGTHHVRADVNHVDEIHLDGLYRGRDLIDLLRARTFRRYGPDGEADDYYPSAWFRDPRTGRKVYVRVSLEVADDAQPV